MTDRAHRAPRPLAALVRVAAVLTLLAGVLAMHGFTAEHSPTPTPGAPAVAGVAAPHADPVIGVADRQVAADGGLMGAHGPAVSQAGAAPVHADGCADCGRHSAPAHSGARMLDICVAVLLGATLILLLLLQARARPLVRAAPRSSATRPVGRRASAALRPPALSMLCVLRT